VRLFSWLFKKKKKDDETPQRHYCEESISRSKRTKSSTKTEAESLLKEDKATSSAAITEASEAADEVAYVATEDTSLTKGFGGAFDIKKSKDGRFVFNLYAANRVIVATSQIYSSAQSAITGIKSVIANAERAAIEDQTLKKPVLQGFPKWEIYLDKGGQYRFRLYATNGSCVLHSQGYTQKSTCKKGIESVIRTAKNAQIDKSYLDKK